MNKEEVNNIFEFNIIKTLFRLLYDKEKISRKEYELLIKNNDYDKFIEYKKSLV